MKREYKFRAWDGSQMHYNVVPWQWDFVISTMSHRCVRSTGTGVLGSGGDTAVMEVPAIRFKELMQFTGFKDRFGKEIYTGDRIAIRSPYRTTQTHTGDNIPNGSYTEPMEPGIKTEEYEVVFQDGMFAGKNLDVKENLMPLAWLIEQQDEESIKNAIWCRSCGLWDDPEEGDLQYLLQEYKLKDLAALIEYVSGCEVTGNIYEDVES